MTTVRRLRTRKSALALAATALLAGAASPASAATCTWNTGSGNWNALANWLNCVTGNGNPAGVPGGADTAVIGAGGTVTVSTSQAIRTLNSAGVVNVNNAVALSLDARSSGASFTGGGQVVLGGSGSRLYVEGGNGVTVGAGSTIRGAGQIGQAVVQSGASLFSHAGTISADSIGESLILLNPGNSGSYANSGLMEARNGGTLDLRSTFAQTASGQMRAENGSTVLLNGSAITGGVVGSTGSGRIRSSNDFANVLSNVTLTGVVDLASSASQLRIVDGLTFSNGAIDVGGSVLYLDNRSIATQSLGGTGSINLAGGALRMEGTGQTTTGANITVRGHGTVGQATSQSGQYTWINNGLVSADTSGQTLNLANPANGNQPVQNNGILEAVNGGRLLLSTDVTAATGSQMRAGAGSVIEMNGVRVTGTVNTTGTGSFRASNNFANNLSGVTLNGNMDLASQASQLRISEGLVLNGSIDIGGSVAYLDNRTTGTQTVSGTGTFNLAGGALRMEGNGQTTTGSTVTISGHGTVGQATSQSGQYLWINNGLVSANVSGQTLNLVNPANGSLPIQNNGTMRATGGGTLQISANVTNGAGSSYDVDTASRIVMNGVTLSGTMNQTGTGAIDVANTFANALTATSLSGRVNVGTGGASQLRLTDGMTMIGGATINVGASGALSFDNRATPTQTVSGNGQIVLNSGTLRFEGGTSTTWGSGITVRGSGSIGQATVQSANHSLFNNGTVIADGGTLSIVPVGNGGTLQGTGVLRVDGGNLSIGTGNASSQGTLDLRATGTLALGTQNLVLSNDYTNAQAGSGNSFNRRAGVTGTGQILAGGNATQVISGSAVSGGNTGNATLTIGNMHVGANTYNYTIGNGGSTGPTLRGAIQTNVNGANLTDGRLSGSGVTAANYNAGAPGAGGAGQTVVFTAANAGALAPLSGQVINLRSNFENIGDQKLNIVLGAGAAAFNLAAGSAGTPVTVANQRVNGSNTAALTISNTAAAGAFSENLTATVGSVGGSALASGSVNNLLAGSSAGGINVGVVTGSAGFKTGTVNLNYTSTGSVGAVSNGLGATSVGGQAVTVSGNVYQAAAGQLQGNALNFGTLQVGQQVSQNLVVRNTASGAAGFVEDLNASFGASGNSQIVGTGSLSGILAGTNSSAANGLMTVTVTGSTAGALNSSIAVNYTSAGAVAGVSNGLGTLGVGSEQFGVNGTISAVANVINQASPLLNTPTVDLGAVRVGATSPTAAVSVGNQATAAPQAALNATIASNGAPITATGGFNGLNPGATSTALQVGLNTAVAGNYTGANAGSATISFVSDASNVGNCAPNCQLNLAPQTVTVSGKVYTAAVGQSSTPVIDFGIVRVGDTVSAKNITVNNTAAVSGLNDTLRASLSGLSGPFTPGAAATGVGAQGSGQIGVGLSTTNAGVFNQTGSVAFVSQNPDMADVSAGASAGVQVKAQVNHLANGDFDLLAGLGLLTKQANGDYVLNLGNVALGSNGHWSLQFDNEVSGPADALKGLFDISSVDDFALGGFGTVDALEAGQALGGLGIDFAATQLGQFQDEVAFNGFSVNASGPDIAQSRRLTIIANVIDPNGGGGTVPEPGMLALLLLSALAAWRTRAAAPQRRSAR